MDLDTRPPEMRRSTIDYWVQRCPHCGYCAAELSKASKEAAVVAKSQAYRRQLENAEYPALANHFLCAALVDQAIGDYRRAAWTRVHAAWACDDATRDGNHDASLLATNAAVKCRLQAVSELRKINQAGQKTVGQADATHAIIVDLLRRAGRLQEAAEACREALEMPLEGILQAVIGYEQELIAGSDTACHNVEEAMARRQASKDHRS